MKPIIFAPLVVLALAGGSAGTYLAVARTGSGEEAAVAQPTATPAPTTMAEAEVAEAEVQVVRWGNLTVHVSEDTGVVAAPDYALTGDQQPVLVLWKDGSFVELDAAAGVVVQESVSSADRAVIETVLATLKVAEQDVATAPWPYSDRPPAVPRERIGNMTYIPPDPAAGIVVKTGIADYFDSRGRVLFIRIATARSRVFLDAAIGLVGADALDYVAAEDKEAFQRFLSEIELVAQ